MGSSLVRSKRVNVSRVCGGLQQQGTMRWHEKYQKATVSSEKKKGKSTTLMNSSFVLIELEPVVAQFLFFFFSFWSLRRGQLVNYLVSSA